MDREKNDPMGKTSWDITRAGHQTDKAIDTLQILLWNGNGK